MHKLFIRQMCTYEPSVAVVCSCGETLRDEGDMGVALSDALQMALDHWEEKDG